ncbi:hypothetical protein OH77DRAFT_1522224 [Trametes cingulata]|nr:hypothetical protein OH77DRAFT_1522224 [Trametes cingulata]
MAEASLESAQSQLDNTYGAFLLGTFVSLILYGVSVLQLYRYARLYPRDNAYIKLLVAAVMILNTVHTIFSMHTWLKEDSYHYLVTYYFNPGVASLGVWSLDLTPAIAVLAALFFARRVYLIGKGFRVVSVLASLCFLGSVGCSIAMSVNSFKLNQLLDFIHQSHKITSAAVMLASCADAFLSSAILCALYWGRDNPARSGSSKFDVAVLYILHTGLLTGLVQLFSGIMAIYWPARLIWAASLLVAIKLYAITLLSVLNSRKLFISCGVEIFSSADTGRNIIARANRLATAEQWNVPRVGDDGPQVISISVAAETEVHSQDNHESNVYDHKNVSLPEKSFLP